ncbi:MAG TPA: hypothetical protein VFH50_01950 [Acidimicrobiales bacterium]|nr:hypothetical protein [Acidimicrobiales bacterium]
MTRGQDPELAGAFGGDDATLAVIAHGLLNSVSAIQMGAHALREGWDRMSEKQRADVLGVVADQAAHVRGVLQDMIRGLPPEVIRVLNELGREPASGS